MTFWNYALSNCCFYLSSEWNFKLFLASKTTAPHDCLQGKVWRFKLLTVSLEFKYWRRRRDFVSLKLHFAESFFIYLACLWLLFSEMSIRIDINRTRCDQLSCAQRAELDKKRKQRITQVNLEIPSLILLRLTSYRFSHTSYVLGQTTIKRNRPERPRGGTKGKGKSIKEIPANKTARVE